MIETNSITTKKIYKPLGTKLLVQLPDENQRNGGLFLPEGSRQPGPQTALVIDIGAAVNEEKFQVKAGDTVCLSLTPVFLFPVNKEERMILVERCDVLAIVTESNE